MSAQIAEIAAAKHLDPIFHAALAFHWRGTVEQAGLAYFQAVTLQQRRVLWDAGKPPGASRLSFRAEHCIELGQDERDIPPATEFSDELPARPKRCSNRFHGSLGVLHPMERGVRKDRVKRFVESKTGGVSENELEVGIVLTGLTEHVGRAVQTR